MTVEWTRVRAAAARFGGGLLAFVSFAAPFAVSLAANVTAGLHSGSQVLLVAGIAIPVLLMLAIELWRRMPPTTGWALAGRSIAMSAPVAVAAGWSWVDTTGLLLAQFPEQGPGSPSTVQYALCLAAPLAVDGLAVLSVLSLRAPAPARAQTTARRTAPEPAPADAGNGPLWGPASSVTPTRSKARDRSAKPTPIRPVTARRTRKELVAAGKALTPAVTRRADETLEEFRPRVEAGEAAAARDRVTA